MSMKLHIRVDFSPDEEFSADMGEKSSQRQWRKQKGVRNKF